MLRRLSLLALGLVLASGAAASGVGAYPWPVRPFDKQHPIRANFGDPRTVFELPLYADGINGPGSFSFHNGVDISAANGIPVFAVAPGIAHLIDGEAVSVETLDGRIFQYYHVIPTVFDGEHVIARQTAIGNVQAPWGHVHLAEIVGTSVTNPLLRGHLTPYVDRTRPRVEAIEIRDALGRLAEPLAVCGRISLAAEASDRPALTTRGSFAGLPVAPALVSWRLQHVGGPMIVRTTAAVDFRTTLPAPRDFWNVYGRGSYQNAPRFGRQQFGYMPGRFLFRLANELNTKTLPNGPYILTVIAKDERGNAGDLTQRFWVFNQRTPSGCPVTPTPPVAASPTPPLPPLPAQPDVTAAAVTTP